MSIKKLETIDLPHIHDPRGDLTLIEGGRHIPFPFARVYYHYDAPVDAERGEHAHRALEQVIFAFSGCFRVKVDGCTNKTEYWLREPHLGLYLKDNIRSYDQFLAKVRNAKP